MTPLMPEELLLLNVLLRDDVVVPEKKWGFYLTSRTPPGYGSASHVAVAFTSHVLSQHNWRASWPSKFEIDYRLFVGMLLVCQNLS